MNKYPRETEPILTGSESSVSRLKVPNGWLVFKHGYVGAFVYDPKYEWIIEDAK